MKVFNPFKAVLVLFALGWMSIQSAAFAQSQPQAQLPPLLGDSVVIAMMINIEKGKSNADAVKAMRAVGAYIHKKPGFIDDVLLASTFPNNNPSHVHISRWRALQDWEALSADDAFLKLIEKHSAFFSWSSAEVFKPVK